MRFVVLTVAALLTLACGGSDATAPSHAGTYTLVSINGQTLPILLEESELGQVELTHGEIVLHDDHTFDDVLEFTETVDGEGTPESFVEKGTWEVRGSVLRMTYEADPTPLEAELENGRIIQQLGPLRFVYQK